jgi:aldose 1-epimerase
MKQPGVLFLLLPVMSQAANYSATRTTIDNIEVIRLADEERHTEVLIAPSLGNNSYEMKVKGKRVFWSPYSSVGELKAKPVLMGNPFLAPWANRIDSDAYFANGKKYFLNRELNNVRSDGNRNPIHGLLLFADWKVKSFTADERGAEVTSRLEYWRNPDWMAQFPFAHSYEMTYRLRDGILEVETVIENHSTSTMPVSVGYHPYFQVNDAPRDQWKVHLAAKESMLLSKQLVPTGETKPNPYSSPQSLTGTQLDDVFTGLVRDDQGRAEFWVQGAKEKISVIYGPKYPIAVVYAPEGRGFICFEPMSGPTNAFNLAHRGAYKDLQTIPPGSTWRESFWIMPSGY